MSQSIAVNPPRVGEYYAFTYAADATLAGLPGRVIAVSPQLSAGYYLLTLEYATPVKYRGAWLTHIDAKSSDVWQVQERQV